MDNKKGFELLKEYNEEKFHIQHGITVSKIMEYFAEKNEEDPTYWGEVGLLHDVDFEKYPEKHCVKAVDILKENGYDDEFIRHIVSHGYGICSDVEPVEYMEKVLFSVDELSGIIFAYALMRPSKSTKDMKLKSLKKKFKDKSFAAGCSRDTIKKGAEMLGVELDELLQMTLDAMAEKEDDINKEYEEYIIENK